MRAAGETLSSLPGPATLAASLFEGMSRREGPALRFPTGEGRSDLSYPELVERAGRLAKGLIEIGVEPGDRVAILSTTRAEWTLADLAILWSGGVVVPVYPTNSAAECEHVLRDSGARVVFCEDAEQLAKVRSVRDRLPALEWTVAFTVNGAFGLDDLASRGERLADSRLRAKIRTKEPRETCTVVYTSGTTGAPKGCVLTEGNLRANLDMVQQRIAFGAGENTIYLWLPLAHVLGRMVQLLALDQGATLAYWSGDPARMLEDVAELQPTHFPSVPRVFEKVHTAAIAGAERSRLKRRVLPWAIEVGRRRQLARERRGRTPLRLTLPYALADALVLRRIRRLFGSQLEFAVTGAAPLDPEILRFFHAAGVYVLEGYGMTETTAVSTVNTIDEHRFGTVGRPLPGCEIRIAADGEVLVKGPHVFGGYFGRAGDEAEPITDGWLATGDLGSVDVDGFLTITGRKKDVIITSSGKNVTPASIEAALEQNRWISHAVVYGDRRPYLTALITLDPAEASALATELGISEDLAVLAGSGQVRARIQAAVDEANARFAPVEQVKRFAILDRDLSEATGELTPTAKVKRQVVYARHAPEFDRLYGQATLPDTVTLPSPATRSR
jgi:long-chain acyl-CoA synthetase